MPAKTFATQLTHLFVHPYMPESRFDMVCRLVCKTVGASSASILMYSGREDEIHCKGRYLDPEVGKVTVENNPVLSDIMQKICAYEFLHASEEKIGVEKEEDLYRDYEEDAWPGETISREDFSRLLNDIAGWKMEYENLLSVYQDERYDIDKDTEMVTGNWFKHLLKNGQTYSPEILARNLDEVGNEKKFYCMASLESRLGLRFSAKFYVGLPLFAVGRYFGVLRLLFPAERESFFINHGNQWAISEADKEKFLDIARQVSYHLEIYYFLNGYKNTILSSKKHAGQQEPLELFLNSHCELLSEIIKSRGALIRRWDEDKKVYEITGSSENLKVYIEKTKDHDHIFFKAFSEKFEQEKILGVYFNCMEFPFKVTKFIYDEEKGRLKYEHAEWDIMELKESDILLTLIELDLVNIAIFPIPGMTKYFIVLYNTENREFLNEDIEMIYPALKNFGLELQAREYTGSVEERMNIISRMHLEIAKTLAEKKCKTYEFVIEFLHILSNTVNRLGIFPYHIIWEYVREILPKESPTGNRHILRNITRDIFQDNPFRVKHDEYRELQMAGDEFAEKILHYFKGHRLMGLFEFPLDDRYAYLDLPFFSGYGLGVLSPDTKLVGIITLIYRQEDTTLVTGKEFFNFLEFFSHQLSIAWEQFQEQLATKIQEKLDHEIRFDKKEKIRSKKEELTKIAKALADELNGDLCCFFLANEQDKTLKMEAASIPFKGNVIYSLANDTKSLSVISYQSNKNFRIFGRKNLEALADMKRLAELEYIVKDNMLVNYSKQQKNYPNILMEHWLSEVITIGEKKLGLITLFRVKGTDNPVDEKRFNYVTPPFSEFESNLLNRVQKHIFNIIFASQTIQQRMEDMRNVLHQVIAPLNALVAQSANIAEGVVPRDSIPEKLAYMNVLAKLAAKYARNFQKILDIDTGNIKLYKETIPDLRKYLIGLAIDYHALIKSKCIHIYVTPDTPNNLALEVDKDLFDHAVSNLIDNAVKYSFYPEERIKLGLQGKPSSPLDKENVLISAQEKGNTITITISNWGIAMSDDERKNIFKREFRGAKAIDWAPVGTGIGLFLAREIIKLHDGQIDLVPSDHENHIVFKIIIPKKDKGGIYG